MRKALDNHLKVALIGNVANGFFSTGLNLLSWLFTVITLFLCIHFKSSQDAALSGLVLSYLLGMQISIIWMFRLFVFNQGRLVSYERLINFSKVI